MQIPWGQKTGFVPAVSLMPRGCPGTEEAIYGGSDFCRFLNGCHRKNLLFGKC